MGKNTHDIKISLKRGGMFNNDFLSDELIRKIVDIASEVATKVSFDMMSENALKNMSHLEASRLSTLDHSIDNRDKDVHMMLPENNVKNVDMWQLCYICNPNETSGVIKRREERHIKSNKNDISVFFYGSKYYEDEIDYLLKSDTIKTLAKIISSKKHSNNFNMLGYQIHIVKRFNPNTLDVYYNAYLWGIFNIKEEVVASYLVPLSEFITDVYEKMDNVYVINITESDSELVEYYRSVIEILFDSDYTEKFHKNDIQTLYSYEIEKFKQQLEDETDEEDDAES